MTFSHRRIGLSMLARQALGAISLLGVALFVSPVAQSAVFAIDGGQLVYAL